MARLDAECSRCGARLSKYRHPRDKECAPCHAKIIDASMRHAHTAARDQPRKRQAFAYRWRGYEWSTIAVMLDYTTEQAATSAARDYAKRNGFVLP